MKSEPKSGFSCIKLHENPIEAVGPKIYCQPGPYASRLPGRGKANEATYYFTKSLMMNNDALLEMNDSWLKEFRPGLPNFPIEKFDSAWF